MDEARYRELKEKMAAVNSLYASRHYSQCAKLGELLLSETHDQTHPLHLAHLNFYSALSHDTLAREASLRNRWRELSLADQHYTAAIHALSPLLSSFPSQQEAPWSPALSVSSPYMESSQRRSSISSHTSAASSATSIDEDDYMDFPLPPKPAHHTHGSVKNPTHSQSRTMETATAPLQLRSSTPRPVTPQQFYFTANIAAFARLLEAHRADVRAQKERAGAPSVRFASLEEPLRTSPELVKTRWSRDGGRGGEEGEAERRRERRKNVVFRPRFDPEGVRRLCGEAMAELVV
ncbi:hypothetical protein G6514_001824 [Epicoccum nigrum]|nr:hypothetical protein G6514_001824 [Epicoccum nigrum]